MNKVPSLKCSHWIWPPRKRKQLENARSRTPFELQDVQFESKKSTLSRRSEIILRALANHLERQPELRLDIDGHTDDIGEAQDNLALSQSRAEAVKAFLMSCGVDGDRMTTQGHGESRPKTRTPPRATHQPSDRVSVDGLTVRRGQGFISVV